MASPEQIAGTSTGARAGSPGDKICVMVGPSGCGKTTILRIRPHLEQQSSGTVSVRQADRSKPINSMVFQEHSVFPWMTVHDNVGYGLAMRRVPKKQREETISYYIEKVGLGKFQKAYPFQLSGGMKQRVSLARAFANDPEVLLMDEPFGALDEQNKLLLQEELLRIWTEHRKTVVFITHSVDEAVFLGDRIMVMTAQPGKVKAFVPVPLARPRNIMELQKSPQYGELIAHIWTSLRDEVHRARQQEEEMKS